MLNELAKLMKSRAALEVLIVGHTDNAGALEYNRGLSERRAQSVVESLAGKYGIARDRLTAIGVGMAAPVASNADEAGREESARRAREALRARLAIPTGRMFLSLQRGRGG